jgi:hypothetical protein
VPLSFNETHTAPRNASDPLQSFDTELHALQGQIVADTDFDLLRITAGTDFGLVSPGHTTLTKLGSGDFNVDSFFDVIYRIDFVGKPGGTFSGQSGSTTGGVTLQAGEPVQTAEPGSLVLLGLGLAGLGIIRRHHV